MKMVRMKQNMAFIFFVIILFWTFGTILFRYIGGEQLSWGKSEQEIFVPDSTHGAEPLYGSHHLNQSIVLSGDRINILGFKTCTYGRNNQGTLLAKLVEQDTGHVMIQQSFDMAEVPDNEFVYLDLSEPLSIVSGHTYILQLSGESQNRELAASAVYNQNIELANSTLSYDGTVMMGSLCLDIQQSDALWFGHHYWKVMGTLGVLLLCYGTFLYYRYKKQRPTLVFKYLSSIYHYRFLIKQLVSRDFKTKYKRSVLGIVWSFLNPLLTMLVQYIVFSTIFKTDITNFPVYLLVGVVFFNFFSESCGMGLNSIVGNAPLITKVYIPKYIFPLSRVISSFVNFALALIPMFMVLLLTGQQITKAVLLLPFSLICTWIFCLGMVLILSALMVFFRDVQFLWNVLSMLWMYATPIFYPESIIPSKFAFVHQINPLYHFIRFARVVLLEGVSPEPKSYLFCIMAAAVPVIIGIVLFCKTQDRFVLYV